MTIHQKEQMFVINYNPLRRYVFALSVQDAHIIPPDDEDDTEDQCENVVQETNPNAEDPQEEHLLGSTYSCLEEAATI